MPEIIVNNVSCKLIAQPHHLDDLIAAFRLRVPGAFHTEAFRRRQWDGFFYFIKRTGMFSPGLLPQVIHKIKEMGLKVKLIDNRKIILPDETITELGGDTLRPYQLSAVEAISNNKVKSIPFPRGILHEATNAGKTLIAAALFMSYPEDTTICYFIHRKNLFDQAIKDLTRLLGKDNIGVIGNGIIKPGRVTICMTPTAVNHLGNPKVKKLFSSTQVMVVDECHRSLSPTYQKVLKELWNCPVRVGVSGTPLQHKDKIKNQKIIELFGEVLHTVTNVDLIEGGYSTKPVIRVRLGETNVKPALSYKEEYDQVITHNTKRHKKVWKRVDKNISKGRLPALIFVKYVDHANNLLKSIPKHIKETYKIGVINTKVKRPKLKAILQDFKVGKIDILIASHLLSEGENMPLIRYAINAGGSSSEITIIQWLGRMLRKSDNKKKVYIEDLYDLGRYLKRHSKRRIRYFQAQGLEVNKIYLTQAKKRSIKVY